MKRKSRAGLSFILFICMLFAGICSCPSWTEASFGVPFSADPVSQSFVSQAQAPVEEGCTRELIENGHSQFTVQAATLRSTLERRAGRTQIVSLDGVSVSNRFHGVFISGSARVPLKKASADIIQFIHKQDGKK